MTGEEFKTIRLYMGLTQSQFADMLGIGYSTVGLYETGRRQVSPATIAKLSRNFRITDEYLTFIETRKQLTE